MDKYPGGIGTIGSTTRLSCRVHTLLHHCYYTMKNSYKMENGRYVTLDSYRRSYERRGNILSVLLALLIAAATGAAVVGVDVTAPTAGPTTPAHTTGP